MERPPNDTELIAHKESGWFDGKRYNVGHLFVWAKERFPAEDVDTVSLSNQISNLEINSESLDKIDPSKPILLSHTGHVIDGRHRLYRDATENRSTIKAIRLPKDLPREMEM